MTLQAFLAGKPVITTTDSGGVLDWVEHGVTGLVAEPTRSPSARRSCRLAAEPALAAGLGAAGQATAPPSTGRRWWRRCCGRARDPAAPGGQGRGIGHRLAPLRALLRALAGAVEVQALCAAGGGPARCC